MNLMKNSDIILKSTKKGDIADVSISYLIFKDDYYDIDMTKDANTISTRMWNKVTF